MRSGGITRRWIRNTLSVISVLVLVIVVAASVTLKQYYYRMAENTIDSKVQQTSVRTFFKNYVDSSDQVFEEGAREFIESFSYSYIMDVWVVDGGGNVIVTSSGFLDMDDSVMEDYETALTSEDGSGIWTGDNASDEKIMAKTLTIVNSDGSVAGAVRMMVSLEDLDKQHIKYTLFICFLGLLAIALVTISGSFFIRSIVRPVGRINETAKLIAKGDFSARVEKENTNDEISELCDTVNYMCEEIARADNVKNDFMSTVSHELRTPLTAIKGWAETIKTVGPDDREMNEKGIDIIISETDRLYNIVEDLLDFSKMQSGRMTMRAEPIDAVEELNMAVSVFNDRADRDGITLIYTEPFFEAPMLADKKLIIQVFANIHDKAFNFTKSGGRVAVFAEISDGDFIVSIADTGCGISNEDLPHVKEKFYKANVSVRGSGIGLAVVDEIIAMHKGQLDISSTEGKGTVVTIVLPTDNTVVPAAGI